MTSTHLKQQVLTCLQKSSKKPFLTKIQLSLDTRNDYEYDLGHFRGAIRPDIRNFRELPQWVRDNKEKIHGQACRGLLYRWGSL